MVGFNEGNNNDEQGKNSPDPELLRQAMEIFDQLEKEITALQVNEDHLSADERIELNRKEAELGY